MFLPETTKMNSCSYYKPFLAPPQLHVPFPTKEPLFKMNEEDMQGACQDVEAGGSEFRIVTINRWVFLLA